MDNGSSPSAHTLYFANTKLDEVFGKKIFAESSTYKYSGSLEKP